MINTSDLHNLAVESEGGSTSNAVNPALDEPTALAENESSSNQEPAEALKPLDFGSSQGFIMDQKTNKMAVALV